MAPARWQRGAEDRQQNDTHVVESLVFWSPYLHPAIDSPRDLGQVVSPLHASAPHMRAEDNLHARFAVSREGRWPFAEHGRCGQCGPKEAGGWRAQSSAQSF